MKIQNDMAIKVNLITENVLENDTNCETSYVKISEKQIIKYLNSLNIIVRLML